MIFSVAQTALPNSIEEGLEKILFFLEEAKNENSDFVCFPEMSLTGYSKESLSAPHLKESIDQAISQIALECHRLNLGTLIGHAYPENGSVYNRATAITPDGPIAHYDKINLVDIERKFLHPGSKQSVFPIGNHTAGIIICRDQNDPNLAHSLKQMGADLIFLPAAHLNDPVEVRKKIEKDRGIPLARAVENRIHVFLSNPVGSHVGLLSLGNSLIASPEGYVLASAGETEETLISAEIS